MPLANAWIPALLLAVSSAAHADAPPRCVVRGEDVSLGQLSVNGFTVGVSHVKASATMTGSGAAIDVDGVVAFRATTPRLWYTVRTESVVGGGLVTMFPGAHLIGTHLDGTAISGSAVVYAMDVLEGEDKPADEVASTVSVPCDHLTLDWSRDPATPPPAADGTGWRSRNATLTFRAAPRANAPAVTYAAPSCDDDCLAVQGGATKNGYRKVGVVNEGVALTGWVEAAELVRIPDDVLVAHSYGCTGDHENPGAFGFSSSRAPISVATLARGTKIYDAPTGATWATVTADADFEVRYQAGESWAEVVSLPGIQGAAGHAYVPASSLVNPRPRVSGTTR